VSGIRIDFNYGIKAAGMRPVGQDSKGLMWSAAGVRNECAADINIGSYFQRRIKTMATDFQAAAAVCDNATELFERSFNSMLMAESSMAAAAKKSSGNIRKAADDLAQGLAKVEKTANFDRLEKYVGLLERAATAMNLLAELEKTGKLDKIASALK
jgi:Na+-transporting NADH:ubiquinone oxidoreductase subunit NqrC